MCRKPFAAERPSVLRLAHPTEVVSESSDPIQCDRHGPTPATFVCQHLARGAGLGFCTATEDPDDLWPDAWCGACEEVSNADGGWNDENMAVADITMLCTWCYEEARDRNEVRPAP